MTDPGILAAPVTVRACTADDLTAVLALHRAGFVNQWDPAFWRWRFVDNPLRRTDLAGAFAADGRCLAAFGGVPLPCRFDGAPGIAHAGGDVVVLPELRQGLAGARLLQRTAERYFAGFGHARPWLVIGCAEPALRRTIVRHHQCEVLGDVQFLVRDLAMPSPTAAVHDVVTVDTRLPDDVDALWQRCAAEWSTGVERDRRYLDWRYVRHPRVRYTVLTARAPDGAARGIALVRDGGYHEAAFSLVEWLVPRADHAAATALLHAAEAQASAHGRQYLLALFASMQPEFVQLQEQFAFRVRPAPHQFVIRPYGKGLDRRFLFEHWCLSMGDLDFV